ncbi:MAG TPA: hypothetical protein VNN80_33665 [Polyangiaceae bacterium]|nr:hypothetical protein [Polyangiaceae bacterium]
MSSAAPKRGSQDPSWIIQRAWSVFRLHRLQELIIGAIAELRLTPHPELSGLQEQTERPKGPDAAAEAWQACCDELLDACGIPGADTVRAHHVAMVRRYMREESSGWSTVFAQALGTYRQAAAKAVERTLARAA